MSLSNPFNPPPNTQIVKQDALADSIWRRWFEQIWKRIQTGALGGTVTSVAMTVPTEFSVAGSPITTSGTLAVTKATQSANTVFAGPTTGAAAQPTFRALVAADLPSTVAIALKIIYNNETLTIPTNTQVTGHTSISFTGTGNLIIEGTGSLSI